VISVPKGWNSAKFRDTGTVGYNIPMEHNATSEAIFNAAMLPNFLFLLAMVLSMGVLWYLLEMRR